MPLTFTVCHWLNHLHMFSNISTRHFVFPSLICLRVLYLSTPFLTFSAWMMSSRVCLESTLMEARSLVSAYTQCVQNGTWQGVEWHCKARKFHNYTCYKLHKGEYSRIIFLQSNKHGTTNRKSSHICEAYCTYAHIPAPLSSREYNHSWSTLVA